jgi:ectoine hydroxylase-related dioxygenase (phytanoyl-CoA dioxygenase family)
VQNTITKTDVVAEAVRSLDELGYAKIEGAFAEEDVNRARALIEEWAARAEEVTTGDKPPMAEDTPMVWNLQAKDPFFMDFLMRCDELHAVLARKLSDPWYRPLPADEGNYILRNYVARSSDVVRLPMHIDSFIPFKGFFTTSITCSLVLDASDVENGCTMVVPGSHQSGEWADQSGFDQGIPLEANPGDIAMWDSRTWHGATENTSGRTRWVMNATFTPWWIKQAYDIPRGLPQAIYDALSDRQKALLGFTSIPYPDEGVGIDYRRGFDALRDRVEDYWA